MILECEQYLVKIVFGVGGLFESFIIVFVDSIFACFGQSAIRFGGLGSFYCFVSAVLFRWFRFGGLVSVFRVLAHVHVRGVTLVSDFCSRG